MNAAFQKWFGASKVVDAAGRPLVVYHGTDRHFDAFMFHHGINAPVYEAAYFTDSRELASYVAEGHFGREAQVLPVYLKIENPLVIDAKGQHAIRTTDEIRNKMRPSYHHRPHDGVVIRNVREFQQDELTTTYAVFKNSQIKSAVGNRGTFDPRDPDIKHNPSSRLVQFSSADLASDRAFMYAVHRLSDEDRAALQAELNEDIAAWKANQEGKMRLFHGAPTKIIDRIKREGFRRVLGQRTRFAFGMPYDIEVPNLAIFLATKESTARAFGANRTTYGWGDSASVEVLADVHAILDLTQPTRLSGALRKAALCVLTTAEEKPVRSLQDANVHLLLDDPAFVQAVIKAGFDAVQFHEDSETLEELGLRPDKAGTTIAVFDPAKLELLKHFSHPEGLLGWYLDRRTRTSKIKRGSEIE